MFRIELLTYATGMAGIDEPRHIGYLSDIAATRDDALVIIEDYIEARDQSGFHPENGHWWCRNTGAQMTTILVIRGE